VSDDREDIDANLKRKQCGKDEMRGKRRRRRRGEEGFD